MIDLRALRFPFLFGIPVLSQAIGLRGLFVRSSSRWTPGSPVMGSFLSVDPPIFCCQPRPAPFGAAEFFAAHHPKEPFVFLVPVTMSLERPTYALSFAAQCRRFGRAHPHARLIVMANTIREERVLGRLGVDVRFAPQNMFVDERMYHPLPGRRRRFDAIYNAQLAPMKRHDLARLVPSCAYVTKLFETWSPGLKRAQLARFVKSLPQRHEIVNETTADAVVPMDHVGVNEAMASAHVGLCLSKLEGAMYASVEYLLAGLPVVTTRSQGGRDVFFHPDLTLVVDDDPRAVQDGVAAMKARAIPPEHIRATTLRLIRTERQRFNAFVDDLRGRPGVPSPQGWTFDYHHKLARFGLLSDFEAQLTAARGSPTAESMS